MVNNPFLKCYLKGLLGLDKPQPKPPGPVQPQAPLDQPAQLPKPTPKPPQPRSAAYLNRRKGRKGYENGQSYLEIICPYLVSKGEASSKEMLRDLGLPKSTLIFSLNTIMKYCHLSDSGWRRKQKSDYIVNNLLKGHRLVRVGSGRYVLYRLVPVDSVEAKPESISP